uniref:uncharacterized protein LOC120335238 n=1 Tax=Styela clava TaxID=7725 RepID=UPI0019394E69|nr:uncharacterized protein LOC120335238 [Styela clava]
MLRLKVPYPACRAMMDLCSIKRFSTLPSVTAKDGKLEKQIDYKQYSEVMGEQLFPKYLAPTKDFRADWAHDMPAEIDPENCKNVTPEDLKAHQKRQAIRGRLRREFWTKKYHPTNWRYFNLITSDPMFAKFNRVRSVYYTLDDPAKWLSANDYFKAFVVLILTIVYFTYSELGLRRKMEKNVHALHPSINSRAQMD